MALQWVKLHVGLIDNDVFKRLSRAARLTFFYAIPLAGKQDTDGVLAVRTGPMTVEEIAAYTSLPKSQQKDALEELQRAGFMTFGLDEAWRVERWDEKAGSESARLSNAERQRRHRERKAQESNDGNAVTTLRSVTKKVTDREIDRDNYLVRFAHSGIAPKNVTLALLREDDPSWARELAAAFADLHRVQLRNLTPEQRIVVGRFFAAICSNCNRDEKVNRTRGLTAAHAIAKMGVGRSDDMTALQFAKYAWKTLELRGGKPFYKPFDIDLAVKYKVPA